jgi:serine/threonine protein kinase
MSEPRPDIFHCPHCGAENPAAAGPVTCVSCQKVFEPARVETVAQPVPPPSNGAQASAPSEKPSDFVYESPLGPMPELEKGVELGGYRLETEIGRGGMGIVYLGIQKSLERKVAVKVLPRKLASDAKFRARFDREALALAALNHPNIVQIIDRGISGEVCYLVMEYVEGVSLRRLLHDKTLNPEQALTIVPQICTALEYAHGKGIVHRDIKPENILLTTDGQVKITDFGLARIVHGDIAPSDQRLTHTHVLMGTPEYMAPEQREKAKAVDHRADIFSLGVIFYEMLTSELPIGRFQVPSKKVEVDVRLDEVILKSLEKEPNLRYQRAKLLSKDVEGIASTYRTPTSEKFASVAASTSQSPSPATGTKSSTAGGERLMLKGGRQIEIGPKGIRVYEPPIQQPGTLQEPERRWPGISINQRGQKVEIGLGGIRIEQKNGQRVEVGLRGIHISQEDIARAGSAVQTPRPAPVEARETEEIQVRDPQEKGRLSGLAVLAFILALVPLLAIPFLLKLANSPGTSSSFNINLFPIIAVIAALIIWRARKRRA